MRHLVGFALVLSTSALLCLGCADGETENGGGGTGGVAGTGGSAGTGGIGGRGGIGGGDVARLDIFAGIYDPALPGLGISGPAEGIEVCELDTTNCDVTGANGYASLLLPVGQEVGVTARGQGFGSVLESTRVPVEGLFTSVPMSSEQRLVEQYERAESPYPMQETGAVFVTLYSGPNEPAVGATLELLGTTAKRFY